MSFIDAATCCAGRRPPSALGRLATQPGQPARDIATEVAMIRTDQAQLKGLRDGVGLAVAAVGAVVSVVAGNLRSGLAILLVLGAIYFGVATMREAITTW